MAADVEGISTSQIDSMLAMLRNIATRATPPSADIAAIPTAGAQVRTVSFADTLKASLNQLNKGQMEAQQLGERFAAGDNQTSISDVLLSMRKADVGLQLTVQLRNKFVAAYNEIMNMQV